MNLLEFGMVGMIIVVPLHRPAKVLAHAALWWGRRSWAWIMRFVPRQTHQGEREGGRTPCRSGHRLNAPESQQAAAAGPPGQHAPDDDRRAPR